VSESIPLSVPQLAGNEARYLQECIETNYVSSVGPFVERFETAFARFVGSEHAVACASGTAALHVALAVAGAGPGLDVAVSTLTFIASVNAISYTGARPVLVDSETETWNLDAMRLVDEVERRARTGEPLPVAVEPVHVLGHPADLEPLLDLRERYGILLVEDAAEALGARYVEGPLADRHVGTVGDLGCFSFNGNKVMTTGGGGMIVTDDETLARRARHLTTQARLPGRSYEHDEIGFNYRLTNVAAALGLAQLEQLESFLAAKRRIADRYGRALVDLGVGLPPDAPWADPSYWLYSVLVGEGMSQRDRVIDGLAAEGIEARPIWTPAHRHKPYAAMPTLGGDVSEELFRRAVSLPSSVGLPVENQERVVSALRHALT